MIEIFKTNVSRAEVANALVSRIHTVLPDHTANFDLQDCDHILRIKCDGTLRVDSIIEIVNLHGFKAEVLEDSIPGSEEIVISSDVNSAISFSANHT